MKIKLITEAEKLQLLGIFNDFKALTLQNNGYEYIPKYKLSDVENNKINTMNTKSKKPISKRQQQLNRFYLFFVESGQSGEDQIKNYDDIQAMDEPELNSMYNRFFPNEI